MTTNRDDLDELTLREVADLREGLRGEADPRFLGRLRLDLRASHARTLQQLGWFDLEIAVGRLRIVHDGELVHLVTNDPRHFDAYADHVLGFEPAHQRAERVERSVQLVLAGRTSGSEVVYLGALGAFQQAVLRATASIPRGEVRPYGWVARRAGSAGAVRATGTALGHNPVPFVVPCHRVVRSDWHLGNYSAGGTGVKDRVLRWEGVDVERLEHLPATTRFQGSREGKWFCLPACRYALSIQPADLVTFRRASAALAEGYEPCNACLPV